MRQPVRQPVAPSKHAVQRAQQIVTRYLDAAITHTPTESERDAIELLVLLASQRAS